MLEGKRIFITGGAGFIGTTLARELVDRNEIVAFDNLHRDALSGHRPRRATRTSTLDPGRRPRRASTCARPRAGATHFVHCAAIAGVDTVLESPVRTMRVNVIGTYNALEAALATLDTLERFVDFSTSEVFGTHAYNVSEGQVSTIGSVGEARWTYAVSKLAGEHMAHAYHDELAAADRHGAPVQRLRPRPDRRRRDPRVHRGRARRPRPDDPRRRLADPRLVLRDRHGRAASCLPRATRGGRPGVQHRQPALVGHDLRPRPADQAAHRRPGEIVFQPLALRRRRAAHPERREGARAARLGAAGRARRRPREDDRVVPGRRRPHPPRLARRRRGASSPRSPRCSRAGCSRWARRWPSSRRSSPRACEVEHALAVSSGTAALHLAVLALGLEPGDEVLVPAYTFPATANVVALSGLKPVLVDVDPETMNIDPAKIEVGPRTKAILAVHLFGRPLPDARSCPTLPVLEDAAGALGARCRGRACGVARRRRLPQLPPAQDRHDRRGRRGHDERRARSPPRCAAAQPRLALARRRPTCRRRASTTASPTSSARSGIPQLRRLDELLGARTRIADGYGERLRDLPCRCRAPTRATSTAGRPT